MLKLEIDTLDPSWLAALKDEIVTPGFLELKRFLQKEIDSKQKIYPPLEDVYSWYFFPMLHNHKKAKLISSVAGLATVPYTTSAS